MSSLVSTADQLSPSLPLCCLFSCRTKHLSSESSLLLHGARTSSYSFQIPSILLTPSVDLNIFSRASCLFVGVIVSKRHTAAGSLPSCRLPFHSCCYSKNATKHLSVCRSSSPGLHHWSLDKPTLHFECRPGAFLCKRIFGSVVLLENVTSLFVLHTSVH